MLSKEEFYTLTEEEQLALYKKNLRIIEAQKKERAALDVKKAEQLIRIDELHLQIIELELKNEAMSNYLNGEVPTKKKLKGMLIKMLWKSSIT